MNILSKALSQTLIVTAFLLLFNSGCKKDEEENTPVVNETGTMTDIEGNIYQTVKIGNQWWMAENLKVKKYRNGTQIINGQASADWGQSSGVYCLYDNNITSPGLLYNWFAVSDTSNVIAPAGWHIPTDEEWKELERSLGMNNAEADDVSWRGTHEGEKLKIASPSNWSSYGSIWSTNESGFTALAGGCRLFDGRWADPGLFATGFWWTATEKNSTDAWYRYLDYKNADVFRSKCSKNYGFSIRCVKD